ncbi:hybrid sensor histidine kinase/response regulator [Usitatibacter palustris]|uniref:Sensor histidine kinase RcsC n=1 Tax=Usitatibacter palustris TaxID=2732487 RepID=A0A6M4H906_9PROT|nr:response regulator [Usitatibacter palustris]QJR16060.1 Sensor histidine kinase RcsC [Usitatibacter palustris]
MATEDFRRIIESLHMSVAISDARGLITFANAALEQLAGRDAHSLPGFALEKLFAPADRKRIQQNVARIAEGKAASSTLDVRFNTGNDNFRWVQVTMQPALDPRDKAVGVVALVQDIETQRDTENALMASVSRLLALAEATPHAAMIEDVDGDIEIVNEGFCRLLELESAPQSLTGLPAKDVLMKAPDLLKLKRIPILVDDAPAGALYYSLEATVVVEKAASEIALIEKIGEELSVALEGISAIAIRAQQMEFDPGMVEHFQQIRLSTETAMAAIGDLVDFSNVSGGVVLRKATFGLRTALADLIKRVFAAAEERRCRLRMRVEQDVSDQIEGDVERLQLVLKNLLDTAFQLVPGSEITLHIVPEYVTESGIQLSFSISAGMDGGEKPVLSFSPEAGMGVAVAKFMVTAMGGRLEISSRPAAEAIYAFTIEFPVRPAAPAPRRKSFASLVGLSALLVSADPAQRLALSNQLRGWRMDPLEADNAQMAIALLERLHEEGNPVPLLIVSDQLPEQDGFLLAFRVKNHHTLAGTLVMMLASKGKPGDAMACRENGISAYMRYPIAEHQLNEAIVAVTGASVDADETPTLVTRHSLREQRKGATILLADPDRDSQILASHILSKHDCSVVVAHDAKEILAALEQDLYDLVLIETALEGLNTPDTPARLRKAMQRGGEGVRVVALSVEHSADWAKARVAEGYNAALAKPIQKDALVALLTPKEA